MGIIAWIVLGLVAGLIAKSIMGRDRGGVVVTTLLGIVGAVLGGFVARLLGASDPVDQFFSLSTWLAAIGGSILVIAIWNAVSGTRRVGATS